MKAALKLSRLVAAALLLAGCGFAPERPPVPEPPLTPHLRLIGVTEIATGTEYGGTVVGGLSGISYSPERGDYLLISDDRGNDGPARVYTARLAIDAHGIAAPEFTAVHHPRHASGEPFAPSWRPRGAMDRPDAEAARWLPGAGAYVWSSEGDFSRGFGPQLRINRLDGPFVRSLPLPANLMPQDGERGPRGNGTLEGIALSPDARTVWVAMELPLKQDGERATPQDAGAPVRFTAIDLASGRTLRQIAYPLERVPHKRRVLGPQINGVSDILADGAHHLLVLERSYSAGAGFGARLFRIDTRTGSDVLALDALTAGHFKPVTKTLIADLAGLGLSPDNIEGVSWAPRLADGGCVLVFVSDNNFNPAQVTQFIAARYLPPDADGECGESAQ